MELRSPESTGSTFRAVVRYLVAPFALSFSGFHTTDFLLSGVYTWPRTSRILVLTLAILILSYEFVYKEPHDSRGSDHRSLKLLFYACMLPYLLGSAALILLANFAR